MDDTDDDDVDDDDDDNVVCYRSICALSVRSFDLATIGQLRTFSVFASVIYVNCNCNGDIAVMWSETVGLRTRPV